MNPENTAQAHESLSNFVDMLCTFDKIGLSQSEDIISPDRC